MKNLKYLLIIFLLSHFYLGAISQEIKPDYFEPDKDNKKLKRSKNPCYKGNLLYNNGNYDEAIIECTNCIKFMKPILYYNNNPYYIRGCAYLKIGELDKAYNDLKTAITISSFVTGNGYTHQSLSNCLKKLNNYPEAISTLIQGIEMLEKEKTKNYSSISFMYGQLANLYIISNKPKEAINPINKAIEYAEKSDIDKDLFYKTAGIIYCFNNEYIKSKFYFDKLSDNYIYTPYIAFLKGFVNSQQGYYKESLKYFDIAANKKPNNIQYLFYRGKANYYLFNLESANMDLNKVIELDTSSSIYITYSYFYLGEEQKAIEEMIERVDNANGTENYKDECYDLACIYSLNNDVDNAIKYLTIAAENGYDNFAWLKNDLDMDNIRNTQEFKDFLSKYDRE